ncbi:outer membrane lipoprotein carrier protein LolA [Leptospira semungkisensis]|uniref:Outer membrane lipoprotein carrier protein LolA n=1 Tax=Leptospira semungkisensis TaxID=2484985 RepID=A0A4R9FQS4_9LEPT|nr:outer membrane lipoprotein carrier protein LolA [Leptospira semungkisensis]TGK00914.1 outer membrane lipoprotein carrier protein LolA [Leptospira semungkisensis]
MKDTRTVVSLLRTPILSLVVLFFILDLGAQSSAKHNWNSPSEVVKKVRKNFSDLQSYKADFMIQTEANKKVTTKKGVCYYKKGGKIKYEFSDPAGDEIVSDGKTLWIFIKRLNAAGKQDLTLNKSNKSGPIFSPATEEGLSRIFRKYHYKFDSIEQPQISQKDNRKYFVLALEQREKIGGYETMILSVDAETYFIKKAVASDGRGKVTTVEFFGVDRNADIEDGVFNFRPDGNSKIVNNPLVSEE